MMVAMTYQVRKLMARDAESEAAENFPDPGMVICRHRGDHPGHRGHPFLSFPGTPQ